MLDKKCVFLAKQKTKRKHLACGSYIADRCEHFITTDHCVRQVQNSYLQYTVDFIIFPKFELFKNKLIMEVANFNTYTL